MIEAPKFDVIKDINELIEELIRYAKSGYKIKDTVFDYIKLSSDEIAGKIMEKLRQRENIGNEGLF